MFEEIRRLRLERGRLLQKIKVLEQQQQTALSAMKEVLQNKLLLDLLAPDLHHNCEINGRVPVASLSCVPALQLSELKQRLGEAEAERDKLLEELRGGHGVETSDSDDLEEMFDFPGMQGARVQTELLGCTVTFQ